MVIRSASFSMLTHLRQNILAFFLLIPFVSFSIHCSSQTDYVEALVALVEQEIKTGNMPELKSTLFPFVSVQPNLQSTKTARDNVKQLRRAANAAITDDLIRLVQGNAVREEDAEIARAEAAAAVIVKYELTGDNANLFDPSEFNIASAIDKAVKKDLELRLKQYSADIGNLQALAQRQFYGFVIYYPGAFDEEHMWPLKIGGDVEDLRTKETEANSILGNWHEASVKLIHQECQFVNCKENENAPECPSIAQEKARLIPLVKQGRRTLADHLDKCYKAALPITILGEDKNEFIARAKFFKDAHHGLTKHLHHCMKRLSVAYKQNNEADKSAENRRLDFLLRLSLKTEITFNLYERLMNETEFLDLPICFNKQEYNNIMRNYNWIKPKPVDNENETKNGKKSNMGNGDTIIWFVVMIMLIVVSINFLIVVVISFGKKKKKEDQTNVNNASKMRV